MLIQVTRLRKPSKLLSLAAAATLLTAGGCNNAGQGALSGAAIGAGAGAIIGSLSGDFGTGAAIGAVAGGVGGAVIGDQNRRRRQDQWSAYDAPQRSYGTSAD